MRRKGRGIRAALVILAWAGAAHAEGSGAVPQRTQVPASAGSTADHTKFDVLKGPFASGPEVTAACLSCHTEAGMQVMHSIHWQWDFTQPETGQALGKRNVVNAFCGNTASNEARCTSCHTGYGWEDTRVAAPDDPGRVDCLVCHDRSGQYAKQDNLAGHPPLDPVAEGAKTITGAKAWAVDLAKAAMSVGPPGRENCGSCHFYGGGGDNVKHGDLSSVLFDPPLSVDVHMSAEGQDFTCETCHVSDRHVFAGSRYDVTAHDTGGTGLPGQRRDVASCESCHSANPHPATPVGLKLNDHVARVACQTCHIPEFARGGVATKTVWDWSNAGRMKDGEPYAEEAYVQGDGTHLHTYMSKKGTFEWGEDVVPHYAWFDGQVEYTNLDHPIDPAGVAEVNRISGAADDPGARIWPFKRMAGRQAYDTGTNRLVATNVWGPGTDSAYWTNFDWGRSIAAAMEYLGEPYSGSYGFVDTYMYWPITHMVAPAAEAVDCAECHAKGGRMADIAGVYIPGTGTPPGGVLGMVLLGLTAAGVAGHGILRIVSRRKGGSHG